MRRKSKQCDAEVCSKRRQENESLICFPEGKSLRYGIKNKEAVWFEAWGERKDDWEKV